MSEVREARTKESFKCELFTVQFLLTKRVRESVFNAAGHHPSPAEVAFVERQREMQSRAVTPITAPRGARMQALAKRRRDMEIKEFNDVVKPYPHGDDELIFDMRPFGPRQGEAVESYLHNRVIHVNTTGTGNTNRLVVLLCDPEAEIPESAMICIEKLAASGQWAEIRRGYPAKSFAMSA
jgi:hypothetical protein